MTHPAKLTAISLVLDVTTKSGLYGDRRRFTALPDWSGTGRRQRSTAGWTSIRVDKATADKLRALRRTLPESIGQGKMLLVEVLTIIADAKLEPILHAESDVGEKRMHVAGEVHAKARAKRLPPILKEIDRLVKAESHADRIPKAVRK